MDVNDFTREVKPRNKRSKLLKFRDEIGALKKEGYSDMQIRDWLAENGVQVSRQNVQKFIKRYLGNLREDTQAVSPITAPSLAGGGQTTAPMTTTKEGQISDFSGATESRADKLRKLAEEQRNEAEKSRFQHDKTGNNH